MKLAAVSLIAVVGAPLTLTPDQQMEVESYVLAIQKQAAAEREKADYWYNRWKREAKTCL